MTLKKIIYKLFRAEIKNYKLFILCNVGSIAVLYSFLSIVQNKQFMNPSIVNPMISSNIYAPTFLVLIFIGIFIPYSQNVFIKSRQREYGILLTIGMTENEAVYSIIIENLIMSILYLIIGLGLGTLLLLIFLYFINNILEIKNININISIVSYITTAVYVAIIFSVSLVLNIYSMIKSSVIDRIKHTDKSESGKHYNIIFVVGGIVLNIIAFVVMIIFYKLDSNVWFLSLLFCMLGSLLIFFNGEALIEYFKKHFYEKYIKNIFAFSDLKYYYGKNKKIFFATTWVYFVMLFFITLSLIAYTSFGKNAITYNHFHMAYGDIKGSVNPIEEDKIERITLDNGNSITSKDTIKFVRNRVFTVFSVDDINTLMKRNYKVKPNSFIYVYPYDMNDGYNHKLNVKINSLSIEDTKNVARNFLKQGTIVDPLFGRVNCVSDKIILINKEDYNWIAEKSSEYNIKGKLHLYNFNDWKKSSVIVNEVRNELLRKNNIRRDDPFFKVSSRIEEYNTSMKSCKFLIFNIIYVSLLLYFSAIVMIHFKFKMEYESEKRKYFKLYRIGISNIQLKKIIFSKVSIIYFIPCVYSVILNIVNCLYINSSSGGSNLGVLYVFISTLLFIIIHLIFYRLYFINYYKQIIKELSVN